MHKKITVKITDNTTLGEKKFVNSVFGGCDAANAYSGMFDPGILEVLEVWYETHNLLSRHASIH